MKKLLFLFLLVVVIVVAVGGYLVYSGAEYVVEIPERAIAAALQESFPIEQRKSGVLKTTLKDPQLVLDGGTERLQMEMKVDIDLGVADLGLGKSERGAATISSGLRYDREGGRIVLDDARIEQLKIDDLSGDFRGVVEEVVSAALGKHLDGIVVYRIEPGTYEASLAKLFLKDIEVADGAVRAIFGAGP